MPNMARITETRLLQAAVAVAGLVPFAAGLAGIVAGPSMAGTAISAPGLDSHFRYLSGLLLGIGLVFWSLIPGIAGQGRMFRALTLIVAVGGLSRLFGLILEGPPPPPMLFGLAMELVVTPLLCAWQWRVSRR
jgi:hypothetical protein